MRIPEKISKYLIEKSQTFRPGDVLMQKIVELKIYSDLGPTMNMRSIRKTVMFYYKKKFQPTFQFGKTQ